MIVDAAQPQEAPMGREGTTAGRHGPALDQPPWPADTPADEQTMMVVPQMAAHRLAGQLGPASRAVERFRVGQRHVL